MKIGIIGLPNVGKSTLFNALTKAGALCANYPFTTLEPNVGVAVLPDPRLEKIAQIYEAKTVTPTGFEFVDIAGLVKGASLGEGLGNQFLSHVRQVDALAHVLRAFTDENVAHVHARVDPVEDGLVVQTELLLSDLDIAAKAAEKWEKLMKAREPDAEAKHKLYRRVTGQLQSGIPLAVSQFNEEELSWIKESGFLTLKPVLYILNTDEQGMERLDVLKEKMKAKLDAASVIGVCAKIEDELNALEPQEAQEFLKSLGLEEPGMLRVIKEAYKILGLISFFTTENRQTRAWTVVKGTQAPQAAGKIHTDMERGFIRAEVISFSDLERCGSAHKVKEEGRLRLEGKDYVVQDGDIILFRFSV